MSFRPRRGFRQGAVWVILPGESAQLKFDHMDDIDVHGHYVTFSDADRTDWKYKLSTRQLSKLKYRIINGREREETGKVMEPKLD